MRFRAFSAIAAALLLAATVTACGSGEDSESGNGPGSPAAQTTDATSQTGSAADTDASSAASGTDDSGQVSPSGGQAGSEGAATAGPGDTLPVVEAAGSLTEVSYGSVGGMTDGPLFIADALGYFAEQGIKVNFNRFPSGSDALPALVTGSLDVASIAVSAGLLNAIGAGTDFTFVADRQSQQGPGRFGEGFLVSAALTDGVDLDDTDAVADILRGSKIAITGKNTSTELMLVRLLESYGLEETDVTPVVLPFSSMAAAFTSGAIDAGIVLEPFRQGIIADGTAVEVSHFDGIIKQGTMVPLTYSAQFASNTELATGFMVAFLRGAMVMNEALAGDSKAYHDQVVDIIAEYSELPAEAISASDPPGLNPEAPLDISYMEEFQDFMIERGVMKEKIDIAAAVDDSFAAAARDELGIGE